MAGVGFTLYWHSGPRQLGGSPLQEISPASTEVYLSAGPVYIPFPVSRSPAVPGAGEALAPTLQLPTREGTPWAAVGCDGHGITQHAS